MEKLFIRLIDDSKDPILDSNEVNIYYDHINDREVININIPIINELENDDTTKELIELLSQQIDKICKKFNTYNIIVYPNSRWTSFNTAFVYLTQFPCVRAIYIENEFIQFQAF